MASKFIDVEGLKTFKQETDKVYVKQEEGKELIETTEVARLKAMEDGAQVNKIEEIDVNGKSVSIVGKKVDITADVLAPDLVDYAKTADVDTKLADYTKTSELAESEELTGKFLDKETAGTTYATKEEMTNLGTIVGECAKEELDSKKEDPKTGKGDCWVTTDDNHIHYYNGTDFVDLGGDIDLGPYAKTSDIESTYVKTADLQAATAEDIQGIFATE